MVVLFFPPSDSCNFCVSLLIRRQHQAKEADSCFKHHTIYCFTQWQTGHTNGLRDGCCSGLISTPFVVSSQENVPDRGSWQQVSPTSSLCLARLISPHTENNRPYSWQKQLLKKITWGKKRKWSQRLYCPRISPHSSTIITGSLHTKRRILKRISYITSCFHVFAISQ